MVEPAADLVVRGDRQELRVPLRGEGDVVLEARRAARREAAAGRQVDEVGDVAGDDRELLPDVAEDRDRADQPAGVRVSRRA